MVLHPLLVIVLVRANVSEMNICSCEHLFIIMATTCFCQATGAGKRQYRIEETFLFYVHIFLLIDF